MASPSLRTVGFLSCALLLAAGASGCGVDVSQVFASSDNNNSTAGSGPGGSGGQGGSGGNTSSTTEEGGSSTGTTGSTTSNTTGSTSSTTGSTTSSTTSSTTTTTMMPLGDIDCGNTTCPIPGEIWCWDKWGIGTGNDDSGACYDAPVSPFDCNTEIENGGVQTVISCQTADQCGAGDQCCGDVVSFQTGGGTLSYYPTVECRDSCPWPTRVMCKTDGSTAECPVVNLGGNDVQTECGPSTLLPAGFFVCRPPNP